MSMMHENAYDAIPREELYMDTFSGRRFHYVGGGLDEISIEDIAHSLAQVNRYNGHLLRPYSVGEHAILVLSLLDSLFPELQSDPNIGLHRFHALHHDDPEAYLNDLSPMLKTLVPGYRDLEQDVHERICRYYEVPHEMHPLVKKADGIAFVIEKKSLNPTPPVFTNRSPDRDEQIEIADKWIAEVGPVPVHMPHPLDVKTMFLGIHEALKEDLPSVETTDYNATDLTGQL